MKKHQLSDLTKLCFCETENIFLCEWRTRLAAM